MLNYLSLLCQGLDIVTEVSVPVAGDEVQDTYTELYKNNTNNPIRVQVFAELVVPGCGANLSTSNNGADSDKYDVLSLTANGRTESVGIVLLPTLPITNGSSTSPNSSFCSRKCFCFQKNPSWLKKTSNT